MEPETTGRGVVEMVLAAIAEVENLTAEQVASEAAAGEALVVDLREIDERQEMGWIAGSLHAPRGMLEFHADPELPDWHLPDFDRRRRTIVYCSHGARSALAVLTLREMGYRDVAHLSGGFLAWIEDGRPAEFPPGD